MTTEENQPRKRPIDLLRYTAATDIGMRRDENQDSYGVIESSASRFFIVADGMGGVQGGATASKMAVSVVEQYLKDKEVFSAEDICEAISIANKLIFEKGSSDAALNGMGTTFVGMAFVDDKMFVINVGDSRGYCFRKGRSRRLTEDHTLVMELVRSGTITAEQAGNHPVSHMLTRSLGPAPEIEIDCYLNDSGPLPGDIYLLCSDGLYNMVTEKEMAEIIANNNIDQATEMLIELANQRGGTDNITLIIIECEQDFPVDKEKENRAAALEIKQMEQLVKETVGDNVIIETADETQVNGENAEEFDPYYVPQFDPKAKKEEEADGSKEENEKKAAEDKEKKDEAEESAAEVNQKDPLEEKLKQLEKKEDDAEVLPRRSVHMLVGMGILAGTFGGAIVVLLANFLFNSDSPVEQAPPVTAFVPSDENLIEVPRESLQEVRLPEINRAESVVLSMKPSEPQLPAGGSQSKEDANSGVFTRKNLERRRERLQASIADITQNIARFDQPSDEKLVESLQQKEKLYDELREEIKSVKGEIDNSVRRLTIWHGRKTKMKESDLTNLASEVSVSSEEVRKKKEEFELASWNYLKEAEALRYMPSDPEQRKKVEELVEVRSAKIKEMADAVGVAIDSEISEVEKEITSLTLRRESLQDRIDRADYSIQYLKVLINGDEQTKQQKKADLENTLLALQSELSEIESLLPAEQSGKAEESAAVKVPNDQVK